MFLFEGLWNVPWIGTEANPSVPQICSDTLLTVVLLKRKRGKSRLLWLVSHFLWSSATPPNCLDLLVLVYEPNYSRILEIWIKPGLLGS